MPRKPIQPSPHALRALARRDVPLAHAIKSLPAFPGFPSAADGRGTYYESLARAVCYQQLTGKAAATIHRRVCELTPGKGFPRPEAVPKLSDEALRGAGLSRAKVASIRDLSTRINDGRLRLRGLSRLSDDDVTGRLVEVRGIGVWSAQMFLMFQLGRLDVMPATDLGVQEGVRLLDARATRPKPDEVMARAEAWAPLRTVGAWFMWRLVEAKPSKTA